MSNLLRTLTVLLPPPYTPPLLKIMPLRLKDMPPLKMLPPMPPTPSQPLKLTSANSWECSPANTSPFSLLFLSELL